MRQGTSQVRGKPRAPGTLRVKRMKALMRSRVLLTGLRDPHQGEAGDHSRGSFRAVVWTEACVDKTGAEMGDSERDNTFKEFCYKETKKQGCA